MDYGKRMFLCILALIMLCPLGFTVASGADLVEEVTLIAPTRSYTPERAEATRMAGEMWRELGLRVKVVERETSTLVKEQFFDRDHQAFCFFWSARPDRLDPQLFIETYTTKDKLNTSNHKNPEYDKVAEAARTATDPAERKKHIFRAQEILANDAVAIYICAPDSLACFNQARFKGLKPQVGDNPFWNVWNLMSAEPQGEYPFIRAITRNPYTLNPMGSKYSADIETQQVFYDRLVRTGIDGSIQPWAAVKWEWTDPKTCKVTLRKGMKWHDGKEVTSGDVKFTIEYLKKWKQPYLDAYYRNIVSVDAPDPLTVVFQLNGPNAAFIMQSLGQIYILPEHVWANIEKKGVTHPSEWNEKESWVGSGPFQVVYFDREDKVVYKKFKDHFCADKISFDALVYKVYGNMEVALGAVETGEATFTDALQPAQFERALKDPHVTAVSGPTHGYTAIWFNTERAPFNDQTLRVALNHATDKEKIIKATLHGRGSTLWSCIAPANVTWYNPNVPKHEYDLEKAREVLKSAGYSWDAQGRLLKPSK